MNTICGASSYQQKYYFNPDFAKLPESVQQELKEICVGFAEAVGGVFTIDIDERGELSFSVRTADDDPDFDDIASELYVRRLQKEREEFMRRISVFYRVFFLGESLPDENSLSDGSDGAEENSGAGDLP